MRPLPLTILALLVPFTTAQSSQSLTDAIANYSQLSTLSTLLASQPTYLALLSSTNSTNGTGPRTLLLPSNTAFANLYNSTASQNVTNGTIPNIAAQFQYHTLDGAVTSQQLNQPVGFLANSLLKQDLYNHRNNSDVGQVVYLAGMSNGTANVTSGEGDVATMVVVDGQWAGGWFQIVDDFLTLPENCQSVMRDKNATLSSLAASLNRTSLWDTLNTFPNVTCLAPNNVAFSAAGSPQTNLGVNQLGEAIKFHTIAGAAYSPLLHDGLMLSSVNGAPIRVSVNGSGTWFNDARVLQSNVITNNGVIHILDKIMSPLNATTNATSTSSSTASGTATGGASGTGSATKASGSASASSTASAAAGRIVVPNGGFEGVVATMGLLLMGMFWVAV